MADEPDQPPDEYFATLDALYDEQRAKDRITPDPVMYARRAVLKLAADPGVTDDELRQVRDWGAYRQPVFAKESVMMLAEAEWKADKGGNETAAEKYAHMMAEGWASHPNDARRNAEALLAAHGEQVEKSRWTDAIQSVLAGFDKGATANLTDPVTAGLKVAGATEQDILREKERHEAAVENTTGAGLARGAATGIGMLAPTGAATRILGGGIAAGTVAMGLYGGVASKAEGGSFLGGAAEGAALAFLGGKFGEAGIRYLGRLTGGARSAAIDRINSMLATGAAFATSGQAIAGVERLVGVGQGLSAERAAEDFFLGMGFGAAGKTYRQAKFEEATATRARAKAFRQEKWSSDAMTRASLAGEVEAAKAVVRTSLSGQRIATEGHAASFGELAATGELPNRPVPTGEGTTGYQGPMSPPTMAPFETPLGTTFEQSKTAKQPKGLYAGWYIEELPHEAGPATGWGKRLAWQPEPFEARGISRTKQISDFGKYEKPKAPPKSEPGPTSADQVLTPPPEPAGTGGGKGSPPAAPPAASSVPPPADAMTPLQRARSATAEFFLGRGLGNIFRLAPRTAESMSEGSTRKENADAKSIRLENEVKAPTLGAEWWKKKNRDASWRFDSASQEEEMRSLGQSDRGKDTKAGRQFDRLFPTEEAYQAYVATPQYQQMSQKAQEVFGRDIEPGNVEAGVNPDSQKARGVYTGIRTNLAPVEKVGFFQGSAMTGPSITKTGVSRRAAGTAELGYDPSLASRFAHGLRSSGRTLDRVAVVENGLRERVILKPTKGQEVPEGWQYLGLKTEKGVHIEDPSNPATGEIHGQPLYVHPDVAPEMRTWLGLDKVPMNYGIGGAVSRTFTRLSTSGIAEAAGHFTRNVLPQAIRAGEHLGAGVFQKANAYRDPMVRAAAMERVSRYGASKPHYDRTGIGKVVSPASDWLDRVDLATRESILNHVEAEVRAGRAVDSYQNRRNAIMQVGNYNQMTMDWLTRAIRSVPLANVFVVAGKNAVPNAARRLTMSQGMETTGASARITQGARVAATWGAYMMVKGAWNKSVTGEFFPDGVPWWTWATGKKDKKTGRWEYFTDFVFGYDSDLRSTGIGAVSDELRVGGPGNWKRAALSGAQDVGTKLVNIAAGGPLARALDKSSLGDKTRPPSPARMGRALLDAIPIAETGYKIITNSPDDGGVLGGIVESQLGTFTKRLGRTNRQIAHARQGK